MHWVEFGVLGSGTPTPHPERQGTANLVRLNDGYTLFDAGRAAATQMAHIGIHPGLIAGLLPNGCRSGIPRGNGRLISAGL